MMALPTETIAIRITGDDQPGVTSAAMEVLGAAGARIHDIEQMVVRGRLNLEIVADLPTGHEVLRDLLFLGWQRRLAVDFDVAADTASPPAPSLIVSAIGSELAPHDLQSVTSAIAKSGGNIERIRRLAKEPVWCYEFEVSGSDLPEIRHQLMDAAADNPRVDVAVQRAGLARRAQRLIVIDVDSTLIQNEMIDLLADQAGVGDECARITEAAMAGQLDFEESLRQRVALLGGQPEEIIDIAYERLELTAGAETFVHTLKALGYRLGVVSGGFTSFTTRLCAELGIEHSYANTLEVRRGVLTGELVGPVVDRRAKASYLTALAQSERLSLSQVVAVGDGANDLDMLELAGLGVAFCAKPLVRQSADTTVSVPRLDAVLFLLGVRGEELIAAHEGMH